jgi:hypothetical protein
VLPDDVGQLPALETSGHPRAGLFLGAIAMSDTSVEPAQLWGSVTDIKKLEASSIVAATTLTRIFGSGAASIAAWCALYARLENELERYELWLATFKLIQTSQIPRNT